MLNKYLNTVNLFEISHLLSRLVGAFSNFAKVRFQL